VQRLTRATERVARTGDLRPIQVEGDDELARLSHSFNQMLAAVAYARDRQRQLVADAGHELRTPLTSLRTNLELLLAAEAPDAPQLSEKDKSEIHTDLRAQLGELTQLIGDLVELAREDVPQLDPQHVDMVEVVEQALARARRRASDVNFEVDLRPWYLLGEPATLERAVLNLLDNAVKFSPPDGTVRVDLRPAADGFAFLQVADAGPGINDADLPYVFDRFYRSDEARTLPGSGLGLAIVKSAAERHGGAVFAGRSADGGALLGIKLPGRPD
jgi:two-component system sensor histidine kinase MprB